MHHTGTALLDPQVILQAIGIQPGWHIVDFGCGALGHFTLPAARAVGGMGKIYAVDIQKSALTAITRAARYEQLWNVHPVWSDVEIPGATRIPAASAHVTIIANTLHQSQNREGVMAEAHRLTMPGGLILIIEWKAEPTLLGPPLKQRLQQHEIEGLGVALDLPLYSRFSAGDHHGAWLFQRQEVPSAEPTVLHVSQPFAIHSY